MRVFIGSSTEAEKYVAFAVAVLPRYGIEAVPWNTAFAPGESTLESLFKVLERTDGAIFFMTPDDKTWYRGDARRAARDNLIFEAGLFLAVYGRKRVALVVPSVTQKSGKAWKATLPTDLAGLTYAGLSVGRRQDLAQTQLPRVLDEIATMIKTGPRQASEFGATLTDAKLKRLLGPRGVQTAHAIVAPWIEISGPGIGSMMSDSGTREIDILATYRVNEVVRGLARFRADPNARMRVCFADVFDPALAAIYRRKYRDRTDDDMQKGLIESIRMVIAGDENPDDAQRIKAVNGQIGFEPLSRSPDAKISVHLTDQRITFGYYRIDDIAWIVPLDMKLPKGPSPFAWAISKSRLPDMFRYYAEVEFENVIKHARQIFP